MWAHASTYMLPQGSRTVFNSAVILYMDAISSLVFQHQLHFLFFFFSLFDDSAELLWRTNVLRIKRMLRHHVLNERAIWRSSAWSSFKVHLSFTSGKEVSLRVERGVCAPSQPAAWISRAQALQEWTFRKRRLVQRDNLPALFPWDRSIVEFTLALLQENRFVLFGTETM